MIKPKYVVLFLTPIIITLTIAAVATADLNYLAWGVSVGYVSQFIFVYYSTDRIAWELIISMILALTSVVIGYPMLMFIGRAIFMANAGWTAFKILDKKEVQI